MTLQEKVDQLGILGADHADLETLIREGHADGTIGTEPGDYDAYVGDDITATASVAFTLAGP